MPRNLEHADRLPTYQAISLDASVPSLLALYPPIIEYILTDLGKTNDPFFGEQEIAVLSLPGRGAADLSDGLATARGILAEIYENTSTSPEPLSPVGRIVLFRRILESKVLARCGQEAEDDLSYMTEQWGQAIAALEDPYDQVYYLTERDLELTAVGKQSEILATAVARLDELFPTGENALKDEQWERYGWVAKEIRKRGMGQLLVPLVQRVGRLAPEQLSPYALEKVFEILRAGQHDPAESDQYVEGALAGVRRQQKQILRKIVHDITGMRLMDEDVPDLERMIVFPGRPKTGSFEEFLDTFDPGHYFDTAIKPDTFLSRLPAEFPVRKDPQQEDLDELNAVFNRYNDVAQRAAEHFAAQGNLSRAVNIWKTIGEEYESKRAFEDIFAYALAHRSPMIHRRLVDAYRQRWPESEYMVETTINGGYLHYVGNFIYEHRVGDLVLNAEVKQSIEEYDWRLYDFLAEAFTLDSSHPTYEYALSLLKKQKGLAHLGQLHAYDVFKLLNTVLLYKGAQTTAGLS